MTIKEECEGKAEAEIVRRIRKHGQITFAEFMETALYRPEGGYYTSPRGRWGEKGDYVTSLDVSPVFSRLLARQIQEMWVLSGSPPAFELVEAGAGRGWLSTGILAVLRERCAELYDAITVRLIEKNTFLKEPPQEKISWHDGFSGLRSPACACVLSNELIDSFPVHRVLWDGGLKELYVSLEQSRFVEVPGEPSTNELAAYLRQSGIEPVDGMVMEINLQAGRWLETVSSFLKKGFVITIDYGLPARELYSPERRSGTLMCHYRHTLNANPYINIGRQDITAHIDFSMLKTLGETLGLELTGFTTQKNFLLGLGILEELREADAAVSGFDDYERVKYNRAVATLINPGGMGDTFKVMVQHRGIAGYDAPRRPGLKGFSFKDMSSYL